MLHIDSLAKLYDTCHTEQVIAWEKCFLLKQFVLIYDVST